MNKLIRWTVAPVAMIALACGKGDSDRPTSMNESLKRDLQLATTTQNLTISPDEIAPKAAQAEAVKPKKAPSGPRVVRTEKPTVKASVEEVEVAEVEEQIPDIEVVATAAAPSETAAPDAAPPLARPASIPAPAANPGTEPVVAPSGGGSATGAILGGILGAVIRGGVVGDVDHCDPRTDGRRRPIGGGSYYPSPTGTMVGTRGLPGRARPRW